MPSNDSTQTPDSTPLERPEPLSDFLDRGGDPMICRRVACVIDRLEDEPAGHTERMIHALTNPDVIGIGPVLFGDMPREERQDWLLCESWILDLAREPALRERFIEALPEHMRPTLPSWFDPTAADVASITDKAIEVVVLIESIRPTVDEIVALMDRLGPEMDQFEEVHALGHAYMAVADALGTSAVHAGLWKLCEALDPDRPITGNSADGEGLEL